MLLRLEVLQQLQVYNRNTCGARNRATWKLTMELVGFVDADGGVLLSEAHNALCTCMRAGRGGHGRVMFPAACAVGATTVVEVAVLALAETGLGSGFDFFLLDGPLRADVQRGSHSVFTHGVGTGLCCERGLDLQYAPFGDIPPLRPGDSVRWTLGGRRARTLEYAINGVRVGTVFQPLPMNELRTGLFLQDGDSRRLVSGVFVWGALTGTVGPLLCFGKSASRCAGGVWH